jgi:hypothetical protein
MSAPLVVNTRDGVCWTRRTVTSGGIALYAPEGVKTCPDFVMATLAELAEHGIAGSADALPMPVGTAPKPHTPAVGDRYVKRDAPDQGRVVTVNRVWAADDGHTAVAYEWPDPHASYAGSACPLDVFHRTYTVELPMPMGPERLTPQERDMVLGLIADAKPARSSLLLSFAESVRNRREHDHPQWEDFYCLNLSSYMGERSGPVLRRLVDVEAENEQLRARVAELEAGLRTVNTQRGDAAQLIEQQLQHGGESVDVDDLTAALVLDADEIGGAQ